MAIRTYKDAHGRTRYMVEFQQKGERIVRRCPPGVGRAEAQELETTLRKEIFAAVDLGHKPEISLEEAIIRWLRDTLAHKKDQKKPRQNALLLAPFVAGKSLRQVTDAAQEAVRAWTAPKRSSNDARSTAGTRAVAGVVRKPLCSATVNRRLCVLKAAAKHAWKQGWIEDNLSGRITLLPEHNKRKVYLLPAEIRTLAKAAAEKECQAAIMVAAYTGLRAGELLALTTTDITMDALRVAAVKSGAGKTGSRMVPVVPLLRPWLRYLPLNLSYWQLNTAFCKAREAVGMKHVHFHDLRHSTASMLANVGVPLHVVGEILGHANMVTTQRYAHLYDETKRAAMRKLK